MRERLTQYVELLFAGAPGAEEMKQEILQNTLDRYDDLISQGKTEEAAYRLAISGIGDINEILGQQPQAAVSTVEQPVQKESGKRKLLRSIAIALYILCAVPIIISDGNNLGVCLTLVIVAVATAMMVIAGKGKTNDSKNVTNQPVQDYSPENKLRKAIGSTVWLLGTCVYFVISFITGAWYITWIIFPTIACIQGLINAIIDLKEACKK
jgi:hypothetical protein